MKRLSCGIHTNPSTSHDGQRPGTSQLFGDAFADDYDIVFIRCLWLSAWVGLASEDDAWAKNFHDIAWRLWLGYAYAWRRCVQIRITHDFLNDVTSWLLARIRKYKAKTTHALWILITMSCRPNQQIQTREITWLSISFAQLKSVPSKCGHRALPLETWPWYGNCLNKVDNILIVVRQRLM